jgi:hypothetical protein
LTVETKHLTDVHRCLNHPGRMGVDKHPCGAIINRETRESCGYFEGKGVVESCEETRVFSGKLDMLNAQVELEI